MGGTSQGRILRLHSDFNMEGKGSHRSEAAHDHDLWCTNLWTQSSQLRLPQQSRWRNWECLEEEQGGGATDSARSCRQAKEEQG